MQIAGMDIKTIIMYILIAVGIFLLGAPMIGFVPEFMEDLDDTTRMLIGAGCLGGAWYVYSQQKKPIFQDAPEFIS